MLDRRLGWQIEKYILLAIIMLSVLDFFGLVNIFWGYILDLVAWSTVAYLIYVISPTELFFGERHAYSDIGIVLAYVLLSAKDLIGQAVVALPKLHANATNLIKFTSSNATQGFTFSVTQAEMNTYQFLHAVPKSTEISQFIAPYFTLSRSTIDVIISDGTNRIVLQAFPVGFDGAMLGFYNTVVAYSATIQTVCLVLGALLLLGISVFAALKVGVKSPSVLCVLKEEGKPGVMRVFWVFMLFLAFFVMVFNLLFEWMTITNDAPLLVIMIIAIFFLVAAGKAGLEWDAIVEYLSDSVESFYDEVIKLFKKSSTILLGISGFLVLHLLTDIGNFIVPAIVPWFNTVYTSNLGAGHEPLLSMITSSIALAPASLDKAMIIAAYIMSTAGIITLLAIPGIIWYKLFKLRTTQSHDHLPDWKAWHIGIVLACIIVYVMLPVFSIATITTGSLVGVDLTSSPLGERTTVLPWALGAAAFVFIVCVLAGLSNTVRKAMMLGPFAAAVVFFGFYIYFYFTSTFLYYVNMLAHLAQGNHIFVLPVIFLLFSLSVVFFITGFFSFVYEIWRD